MKKRILFFWALPLYCLYPQQNEAVIDEKLGEILSELDKETDFSWDFPPVLAKIISFLQQMNVLFKIVFYLLLAALLLYIVWKISRFFMNERYSVNQKVKKKISSTEKTELRTDYLAEAKAECSKLNFSNAIVLLHRGSVHNLFIKQNLESGRDYTNGEIYKKLSHKPTSEAFYSLAEMSELITFKGRESNENEYNEMEDLYRRYLV